MTTPNLSRYSRDPVAFIDRFIRKDEKGRRFRLSPHQRRVLAATIRWDDAGRLQLKVLLWGEMKKSGKTFLAAALLAWWAFTNPNSETIVAANDLDQSVGRVFKTLVAILKQNSALASSARILAEEVTLSNGTTITAISSDYKGAAGSRHSLVVYDELWGFSLERAERLFEELTPPPTEPNAWVLIVTYAGWTGESALLERFYKQGLAGERIDDQLELYRNGDLFMFWSHTPRQPWQTPEYYASQRAILRPTTFARLHENKWVSSESAFITPELWDSCVQPEHQPLLVSKDETEFVAVDIGIKSDLAAVVRVRRRGNQIVLAGVRIWKPTREQPIDLETTVEAHLLELHAHSAVRRILVDPWQAYSSIQRLKAAGLPIEEFPQTLSNTVRMGQCLYDVLKGKNLVLYADDELRQQALNTIAIETPRGFRIAKEKASKKIDAIVALSMAVCAALDAGDRPPFGISVMGQDAPNDDEIRVTQVGEQRVDESIMKDLAAISRGGGTRWFPNG